MKLSNNRSYIKKYGMMSTFTVLQKKYSTEERFERICYIILYCKNPNYCYLDYGPLTTVYTSLYDHVAP